MAIRNEISTGHNTVGVGVKSEQVSGHCNAREGRDTHHHDTVLHINIDGIWTYLCVDHARQFRTMLTKAIRQGEKS